MNLIPKYPNPQIPISLYPDTRFMKGDGVTHHQALTNLETAIKEWIETAKELGRSVPEPKGRLVFA